MYCLLQPINYYDSLQISFLQYFQTKNLTDKYQKLPYGTKQEEFDRTFKSAEDMATINQIFTFGQWALWGLAFGDAVYNAKSQNGEGVQLTPNGAKYVHKF